MKRRKKKIIFISITCLVILVGALVADHILSKNYLVEIKYSELVQKIDKKETFVLLMSQTTCSHCMDYKPKLANVAKTYKLEMYYLETDLVDEDDYKQLKKYFNFSGTPTTIFVTDGEEKTAANRITGDVSEAKIISKLKNNGYIK